MKKLLLTALGIFLAASLYIGINTYKNINSVSDLLLANVEALADDEDPGSHNHGPTDTNFWGKLHCENTNQVNCAY